MSNRKQETFALRENIKRVPSPLVAGQAVVKEPQFVHSNFSVKVAIESFRADEACQTRHDL